MYDHIRNTLFAETQAMKLTMLTDCLAEFVGKFDYTNDKVNKRTTKYIRRKLESEYNDSLHFVSENNGLVLVFPDNLSMTNIVVENMKLKDKLQPLKEAEVSYIRETIKSMLRMSWPPQADELSAGYIKLAESLLLFLNVLFRGDQTDASPMFLRVVLSVGQYCLYAVSNGTIIPANIFCYHGV